MREERSEGHSDIAKKHDQHKLNSGRLGVEEVRFLIKCFAVIFRFLKSEHVEKILV
jgi:hypothetical protein